MNQWAPAEEQAIDLLDGEPDLGPLGGPVTLQSVCGFPMHTWLYKLGTPVCKFATCLPHQKRRFRGVVTPHSPSTACCIVAHRQRAEGGEQGHGVPAGVPLRRGAGRGARHHCDSAGAAAAPRVLAVQRPFRQASTIRQRSANIRVQWCRRTHAAMQVCREPWVNNRV